jgi:ribosomal protein L7/L12
LLRTSGKLNNDAFAQLRLSERPQRMVEYALSLFLVAAGPRRREVILRVKELFGVSLREARALVDGSELRLPESRGWQDCLRLGAEFEGLGATIRVGF